MILKIWNIKVLLGKRIREYRLKHGLTQFQLAEKLGIDDKHLSRIELGKKYAAGCCHSEVSRSI